MGLAAGRNPAQRVEEPQLLFVLPRKASTTIFFTEGTEVVYNAVRMTRSSSG
jgi:hypothetical protein